MGEVNRVCRTRQEWLDLLVEKSRAGRFPAIDPNRLPDQCPACQYRTDDGRACAVGVLFPDGVIPAECNWQSAQYLFGVRSDLMEYLPEGVTMSEAQQVQEVHDMLAVDPFWDHQRFVAELLELRVFWGLLPAAA